MFGWFSKDTSVVLNVSHMHKNQQKAACQFWDTVKLFSFVEVHLGKSNYPCSWNL